MAHKYGYIYWSISNKGNVPGGTDNLQLAPILLSWQQPHARFQSAPPPFPHSGISTVNMVVIIHVILYIGTHP